MENQPDQQSSPYSQYSQYPSYPPADPYGQAPSYPPPPAQSPYPTPAQAPYPSQPTYPPVQPTYPPQSYPAAGQPYPYGAPGGPNYQQPRKPKNYLWLIIVVAVLVVLVGALAVAVAQSGKGNGSNQTVNATATSVPATNAPATSAPTQAGQQSTPTSAPTQGSSSSGTHKLGDVVSIDNWQVSVISAKISHGGQYDTPQHAGDVYLEIDVSVVNQTGQSQTFSSLLNFTLKDSTGQKYDQAFVSDAPSSPDGTVPNGGKLRGTVVYEVPPTMHTFEFDVAPDSLNSSDVAVWNLSV